MELGIRKRIGKGGHISPLQGAQEGEGGVHQPTSMAP